MLPDPPLDHRDLLNSQKQLALRSQQVDRRNILHMSTSIQSRRQSIKWDRNQGTNQHNNQSTHPVTFLNPSQDIRRYTLKSNRRYTNRGKLVKPHQTSRNNHQGIKRQNPSKYA